MKPWLNWPNVLRSVSLVALITVFTIDFGFNGFAKPPTRELYAALIALVLGVDIPALRNIVLRMLGGGDKGEGK